MEADFRELKKGGMMRQAEAGLFSVRLRVVGGRLSTVQLRAILAAADRFGRGEVHLTARQGIEIPHVGRESLADLKERLAPSGVGIGVCGPTVRTVTACQGCRVCPRGAVDSPALARDLDRAFYGKPVPHKFKIGVSGCANNCMKAEENDVGIKGWIEPAWSPDGCASCGICRAVCKVNAVLAPGEGPALAIDESRCTGCGDCIAACPGGGMREKRRGYALFAGGKMGRSPSLGQRIPGILATAEQAVAAAGAVIGFFRDRGKAGERFGDTLARTGLRALEDRLVERAGLP